MWVLERAFVYLHPLLAAAEQPGVGELQGLLGAGTLLPVVLQAAELALVDGEGLEGLLRTQASLKADNRHHQHFERNPL